MDSSNVLFPPLFEEDYITRSLGSIVNQPDVAITELVANAWDAGASRVRIFVPESVGGMLVIEDDGIGMTEEEFQNHWMKLRYNRLKAQGREVVFPKGVSGKRTAFGRNGIGRHGLFCFSDEYRVISSKGGKRINLVVKANIEQNPIAVIGKEVIDTTEHGTRLEVNVQRNLPNPNRIREIISARFLHDPQFIIEVNHVRLELEDLSGGIEPTIIDVPDTNIHLIAYFIDTSKSSRKSIFQGIAFWQCNRLVGQPNWSLGDNMILDGRTALAKRYTFIIKTTDLSDFVKEDWSGFKESDEMLKVYNAVEEFVEHCFSTVVADTVENITENLEPTIKMALNDVNPLARQEVTSAIREIVCSTPKIKQDSVNIAVKALINVEKSKNGKALLEKLANMSAGDLDGLNALLDKWTIGDALAVLNEIDRRLAIIEAIRKLAEDERTDELHVLHPMIAESRWLFGPEYESSEFIFNRQMRTAITQIFGENCFYRADVNYKKRPDLICLPTSTIAVTGIEEMPDDTGLVRVRQLLLIELKKGGYRISRAERDQAHGYIEDLLASTSLGGNCRVTGFVVGESVADNLAPVIKIGSPELGTLFTTTYSRLVDTAQKRLFNLRGVLADRYDDVPGMDLYRQVKLSI